MNRSHSDLNKRIIAEFWRVVYEVRDFEMTRPGAQRAEVIKKNLNMRKANNE